METTKLFNCDIILDGCNGCRSGFWDKIIMSDNKLTLTPHGDSYNYFISASDIMTRWIDEELRQSKYPLNLSSIIKLLREWKDVTAEINTEHIHIAHLSNKDLNNMKPLSKDLIDRYLPLYIRHPIYFIFLEEESGEEKNLFEHSPLMTMVHNELSENDGSYLFWDPKKHAGLIRKKDLAVIYGENGEKEVKRLITKKYPIKILNLK